MIKSVDQPTKPTNTTTTTKMNKQINIIITRENERRLKQLGLEITINDSETFSGSFGFCARFINYQPRIYIYVPQKIKK